MSNYYNNKINDVKKEAKVSELLVNSFFKPYLNSSELISEKLKQVRGVDIEIPSLGNVDLKSALTRLDGNLNTFCLELFFTNIKGEVVPGWFWFDNKNIETDYYSFNYFTHAQLNESNKYDPHIRYMRDVKDIGTSELVIVNKQKLVDFVKPYWTEETKKKIKMIMSSEFSKTNFVIDEHIKVVYSKKLNEKPLLMLISKSKLIELCDIHTLINHKTNEKTIIKSNVSLH